MKLTCVTILTTFIDLKELSAFHCEMFHGFPRRQGKPPPWMIDYSLANRGTEAVHLVRSGVRVPDIACPSCNWIVRPAVREVLKAFPPIDFLPVIVTKAIDLDYLVGDLSWYDRRPFIEPEKIPDKFPDCPALRKNLDQLTEVLLTEVGDLPQKAVTKRLPVTFGSGTNSIDDELEIPLEFIEAGAIIRQRTIQMLPERAIDALERFFDWRFYHRLDLTI